MVSHSIATTKCICWICLITVFGTVNSLVPVTLPTPVSCSKDEFYCIKDRRCIPEARRCDYQVDCQHGEDERDCGGCNFEDNKCGYTSHGSYEFIRTTPRDTLLSNTPAVDHTTNTSNGYFITSQAIQNKTAPTSKSSFFRSPSLKMTSPRCAVNFFYFYGSLDPTTLKVVAKQQYEAYGESVKSLLWEQELKQTKEWKSATVAVGHRPDVVRSLSFMRAAVRRDGDQNFKKIMESILHQIISPSDISSDGVLKLKSSLADDNGSTKFSDKIGWSLHIEVNHAKVSIDDIQFVNCSYPRPRGQCRQDEKTCYDGSCIGLTQMCDFSRDCADGSDEDVDRCSKLYYNERCSFEDNSVCDWDQDQIDEYDWKIISKSDAPQFPRIDHTTGTSEGKYLAVDASMQMSKTSTKIVSIPFGDERIESGCHMKLFYYIRGEGHTLRIKKQTGSNSTVVKEYTKNTLVANGSIWRSAVVNFKGVERFQVVIEAKIGTPTIGVDVSGVIAIDDISFTPKCYASQIPIPQCHSEDEFDCQNGQCIPCLQKYCQCNFIKECSNGKDEESCESSCGFDDNTCGWRNMDGNKLDWNKYHGLLPSNTTGPPYDHTKKNKDGFYMYVDTKSPNRQSAQMIYPNALLSSPVFQHGAYDCKFSFWYNMYHGIYHWLDAKLLVKYRCTFSKEHRYTILWSADTTTGKAWKYATVQLPNCPQKFSIVFEVIHMWHTKTVVAIDDVQFDCAEKPIRECSSSEYQCYVSKQCIPKESICDCDRNCCDDSDESDELCKEYTRIDFTYGFINGWTSLKTEDFEFILQSGPTATGEYSGCTGPEQDHTFQHLHGRYIYINAKQQGENQAAAIASPTISATKNDSKCEIRFWFNMFGSGVGTLKLYTAISYGVPYKEMWSLSGNQGSSWKKATVELTSDQDFQVMFKAWRGSDNCGDIALDDISMTPGCTKTGQLLPGAPTQMPVDPCKPNFQCPDKKCIDKSKKCNFERDCINGTDEGEPICGYPEGFENGFGPWLNMDKRIAFRRNRGKTPSGLDKDGKGDKSGYYIYLPAKNVEAYSSAILESPEYSNSYSECKMQMAFSMVERGIGKLQVFLVQNGVKPVSLLEWEGGLGKKWIKTNLTIGRRYKPFKIRFNATILKNGDKGLIGIDEINFLDCSHPRKHCNEPDSFKCDNNYCIPKSKLCDLVDDCGDRSDEDINKECVGYKFCDFDEYQCNFTFAKDGTFNWTMNNGTTESSNTGPTHDHTHMTAKGNYLYIEASNQNPGAVARLQTFPLDTRNSKGRCFMKFYYHAFGATLGKLSVNILRGKKNKTRKVWKTFGKPSKHNWRHAVVDFSNITDEFQVEFEGVVGRSFSGDIAIDDIIFSPKCFDTSFPTTILTIVNTTKQPTVKCLLTDPRCSNGTEMQQRCENMPLNDPCHKLYPRSRLRKTNYDTFLIALLTVLFIVAISSAAVVFVVTRKKKGTKFHIYSIFSDAMGNKETDTKMA